MAKTIFKYFMIVFATVEPIATIPQIVQIWGAHNTAGVSLMTWVFYTLTSGIWLAYGIIQKDRVLIISGAAWVISQGCVVLGLLLNLH
jgi:uncharacterized protein with PQ loop repeat